MAPYFPAQSGSIRHFDAAGAPKFAIPATPEYGGCSAVKSISFFAPSPSPDLAYLQVFLSLFPAPRSRFRLHRRRGFRGEASQAEFCSLPALQTVAGHEWWKGTGYMSEYPRQSWT